MRFRHIVAADLAERGSPIAKLEYFRMDGKIWTTVSPTRKITKFEFESKVMGATITPQVLFDLKPATFILEESGAITYCDFPSTYQFMSFPLLQPYAYADKVIKRADIFKDVKINTMLLYNDLQKGYLNSTKPKKLLTALRTWQEDNKKIFPYMFLTLVSDEPFLENFSRLLEARLGNMAHQEILTTFRSEYVAEAASKKLSLPIKRGFYFPPPVKIEDVFVPTTLLSKEKSRMYLEKFLVAIGRPTDNEVEKRYNIEKPLAQLIYEMSEENYYLWQSYALLINYVLFFLGNALMEAGAIISHSNILDITLSELESILEF